MSILNVNQIQPVGSGQTVTISAANITASSSTISASSFVGPLTGDATGLSGSPTLTGITSVSTTNLTVNGNAYPSAGSLSNRNLIINGAMQVAQRGTSFAVTTDNTYTVDRFQTLQSGLFNLNSTLTQSSTAPAGFTSSLKVDVTTTSTPTGGQNGLIGHKVEAQNLQHLQYGTSGAQTCTLTFWVRSNKTGTYCVQILQQDASKYQLHEYSISSADTWEQKTITIVGNTADAINNDNGKGFDIRWHLACGPDDHVAASSTWTGSSEAYLATSNQVNLFDSTSNEWYLAGVQLEVGTVATPFEHRSYGDELLRCQRYYCQSVPGSRVATSMTNEMLFGRGESYLSWTYPVIMRAVPSVVTSNDTGTGVGYYTVSSVNNYTNGTVLRNGVNQYALLTPSSNASYNTKTGYNADAEL